MKLSEKEIMYIINEAKMLLTEDQESDSIRKAIALYMDIMGCSKEEANKFIREGLREKFPNLRNKKEGKFILGTTRMFLHRQFENDNKRQIFNATLPYIASDANYQKYDKNLNGLSADEIIERFREERESAVTAEKEKLAKQEYEKNSLYDIVRIDTFEQSRQYAQYCYQKDIWCITKYPHMLNSYTDDGIGQFYFCLKKGFENMEPVQGEGCPLDEYGLSMIAVNVNGDGSLKNCTCRWNHSNGGNDNVMNAEEISKVIGVNFYEVFKPNDTLQELIKDKVQRFKNGENIRDVFDYVFNVVDDIYKVEVQNFTNYVNIGNRELVSDKWFTHGSSLANGLFITVEYDGREVCLDITDGNLYDKDEVSHIMGQRILDYLNSGGDVSELKEKKLVTSIFKTWNLPNAYEVRCMRKYNIIMNDNRFLFEKWYDSINDLKYLNDIYYRIEDDGNFFLLNDKKENVLGTSYKYLGVSFLQGGTIEIFDEEGANIININNPSIKLCKRSAQDHMNLLRYSENPKDMLFSAQEWDGLRYIYDADGNLKINMGFASMQDYSFNNIISVRKNEKYAVIFTDDFEISNWYDKMENLYFSKFDPYIEIYKDGKIGFLNAYTREELPDWFSKIEYLTVGDYIVYNTDNLCNLFIHGKLVLPDWFSKIEQCSKYGNDYYITNSDGKMNMVTYDKSSKTYNYIFEHWYDNVSYDNSNYYITVTENGNTLSCQIWDVKRNNL